MRDDVHSRRVEPQEKRLVGLASLVDELQRVVENFVIHGLHPLGIEFPGVLDLLLADLAPARLTVASSSSVAQQWSMFRGPTVALSAGG